MEGPPLHPSFKVHQLRQLMSLDCPYVTLTSSSTTKNTKKFGSHKLKIRPSFTTTGNKTFIQTRITNLTKSSSPCLICTCPGSNKSLITKTQQRPSVFVSLLMEGGCRVLEGEESWVFCNVCHGTITKLLRLMEEVDDIKTRISAVLKLRGKLDEDEKCLSRCGMSEIKSLLPAPSSSEDDEEVNVGDDNHHQDPSLTQVHKDLEVEKRRGPPFIVSKDEEAEEDEDVRDLSVPQETDEGTPSPSSAHEDIPSSSSTTLEQRSKANNISPGRRQQSTSILRPPLVCPPCYFCNKTFPSITTSVSSFQAHLRLHHTLERPHLRKPRMMPQRHHMSKGVGAHKCPKCGTVFSNRSNLNKHMRNLHSLDIPKKHFKHFCSICKKFFASDLVFQAHSHPNPSDPEKVLYTCAVCNKTYNTRASFHQHKARHHSRRQKVPIPCYFCSKTFKDTVALQYHMRTHTLERPFMCGNCGIGFPGPCALERHTSRNCGTEEKTPGHQCHLCGKVLGSRGSLLDHMNWIHAEKTKILLPASATTSEGHICPECGKIFQQKYRLTVHMKRVHRLDPILPPSETSCPICRCVFMSRELFNAHTHPDESDPSKVVYTCSVCGRLYGSRQSYHIHVVNFHRDQAPAQCQSCGRVFQSARAANAHRKFCSSSEEAKTCSMEGCDQVFPTPRDRVDHERVVHKGQSSTKCPLCSKLFRSTGHLKIHVKTHDRMKMDNN